MIDPSMVHFSKALCRLEGLEKTHVHASSLLVSAIRTEEMSPVLAHRICGSVARNNADLERG